MSSQGNSDSNDNPNGDFFSTIPTFTNLQLDIVGFLAILGEGSVLANAQVSTLSRWIFLPRLLPAPQALLRPSRPTKLDQEEGYVTGVVSGNHREKLNHIGHIVLQPSSMKEYDVRCVRITRKEEGKAPVVKARAMSYLTVNNLLGCACSIAILVLSVIWEDGMAIISVCSLSLLSTVIGLGNYWKLKLPRRYTKGEVPQGDVVIRHPKGSFLVVECDEDIAREIFFAPENIEYLIEHQHVYRLLSLAGSMMLMAGVICLANCRVRTQTCFAAAYMILNAAYWIVAAFPARLHWDTSAFEVSKFRLDTSDTDKHFTDHNKTFTEALWKVIVATKGDISWVRLGSAAPDTAGWNAWLRAASRAVKAGHDRGIGKYTSREQGMKIYKVPDWDPQKNLGKYLKNPELDAPDSPMEPVPDTPATSASSRPDGPLNRNPTAAAKDMYNQHRNAASTTASASPQDIQLEEFPKRDPR